MSSTGKSHTRMADRMRRVCVLRRCATRPSRSVSFISNSKQLFRQQHTLHPVYFSAFVPSCNRWRRPAAGRSSTSHPLRSWPAPSAATATSPPVRRPGPDQVDCSGVGQAESGQLDPSGIDQDTHERVGSRRHLPDRAAPPSPGRCPTSSFTWPATSPATRPLGVRCRRRMYRGLGAQGLLRNRDRPTARVGHVATR